MPDKVMMNCATGEITQEPLTAHELQHRDRDVKEFHQLTEAARLEADLRNTVVTKLAALIQMPADDIRKALKLGGHSQDPLAAERDNAPRATN